MRFQFPNEQISSSCLHHCPWYSYLVCVAMSIGSKRICTLWRCKEKLPPRTGSARKHTAEENTFLSLLFLFLLKKSKSKYGIWYLFVLLSVSSFQIGQISTPHSVGHVVIDTVLVVMYLKVI